LPGNNRVLIIVENLPCPFDRRVWQEARALVSHGYEVSIICPKGRGYNLSYEFLEGIHIHRYSLPVEADSPVGYGLEYLFSLAMQFGLALKIALSRGFDIIHGCNPPDTIFLIGRFFRLFGKRFVFDHHDICPELYEAKFGRRDFYYRLLRRLERWTFNTADISIATNESYRRIAIERGGMDPKRVFVVRSGADLSRVKLTPPRPELRRGRRFLVGYVGVIGKQEGIDLLLQSVVVLRERLQRTDVHFAIVGSGTEVESLKALSKRLGIEDCVEFMGRLPDGPLWELLSTADVCVNPDRANEMNDKSTMNKILEYMALGKPIVQFDLTEGRVSAGEASLYARPNDVDDFAAKLCELLDDEEKRQRMGAVGRARVERELAWNHQIPHLLSAYATLDSPSAGSAVTSRHSHSHSHIDKNQRRTSRS
jgi:glycosyltransferase involved in cell wall biosynthesis